MASEVFKVIQSNTKDPVLQFSKTDTLIISYKNTWKFVLVDEKIIFYS